MAFNIGGKKQEKLMKANLTDEIASIDVAFSAINRNMIKLRQYNDYMKGEIKFDELVVLKEQSFRHKKEGAS